MMTESSDKDGIITIRPHNTDEQFPLFTEIQVRDGWAIGFAGDKISNMQMEYLYRTARPVEVISIAADKIVLKRL